MQMGTGMQPMKLWLRRAIQRRPPGTAGGQRFSGPKLQRLQNDMHYAISRPPPAGGVGINGKRQCLRHQKRGHQIFRASPSSSRPVAAWV